MGKIINSFEDVGKIWMRAQWECENVRRKYMSIVWCGWVCERESSLTRSFWTKAVSYPCSMRDYWKSLKRSSCCLRVFYLCFCENVAFFFASSHLLFSFHSFRRHLVHLHLLGYGHLIMIIQKEFSFLVTQFREFELVYLFSSCFLLRFCLNFEIFFIALIRGL